MPINHEIHLKRRPEGLPGDDVFELVEVSLPDPGEGEFLVQNHWMSVDPYMRGRMRAVRTYVDPFTVGEALDGGCVGRIIRSRHAGWPEGQWVLGDRGWRELWLSDGTGVRRLDPDLAPLPTYLGVMGMPGLTAYVGLVRIAGLRAGDRVYVSAAAGAVGSAACQIARQFGAQVVGSAGSTEKVDWLRREARVEAFDYNQEKRLAVALKRVFPEGIDVYYDNVGGSALEAALQVLRDHGRIAACGMISQYNDRLPPPGPRNLLVVVSKRLTLRGFIVHDHMDLADEFQQRMAGWLRSGEIRAVQTVRQGLASAPGAFRELFTGGNLGKMLVRLLPQ
jgi:NADPH-dependent curcumin reductase CurA